MGILDDDQEWESVLAEAFSSLTGKRARNLFATMLIFCELPRPTEQFEKFVDVLSDDLRFKHSNCAFYLLRAFALHGIAMELNAFARKLSDFSLPPVSRTELAELELIGAEIYTSAVEAEETNFSNEHLSSHVQMCLGKGAGSLNDSQRFVFENVLSKLQRKEQCLLFMDARGGTGKTYTLNAILSAARTLQPERIVPALAVATSGIAATQLFGGRTFHSRFRAPLDIQEHSVLDISVQSSLAELIRNSALIVWDEAPMANRFLLEALDRSLRDITEIDKPLGGKSLVLAGDFR